MGTLTRYFVAIISMLMLPCYSAQETLKEKFNGYFDVGVAIPGTSLSKAEKKLLFDNFTCVTPENIMKPKQIQPAENRYNFERPDALVDMALAHGQTVIGHTLVWHQQCPNWFFRDGDEPADRELVLLRMRDHITKVVSHYKGRVKGWDVVNEALMRGDQMYRKTKWLEIVGKDFIAEAFIAAHKADPDAELYYNDFRLENPQKRKNVIRLVRDLKAKGVHIDGVGIQGHWKLDQVPFQDIEETIIALHKEGMKVMFTEVDLDPVPRNTNGADTSAKEEGENLYPNGLPSHVQQRQAEQYAQLFEIFYKHHDKIDRITFWGLHDGRSWLNSWPYKRTNHPLLWDRKLQPKPAFHAVLDVALQ